MGLEGSSLSVDMRGTPLTARNFLSMATILGWLHLTASWRGVLPHRSSTSRSTYIFDFILDIAYIFDFVLGIAYIFDLTLYWILPIYFIARYIGYFANVRTNLAGLDEVFHAGRMVFHASKMESCPPVVVAHVHVHSCQVGSLKSHLVSLRKRLELRNDETEKRTCEAANNNWTSFRLCSS